MMLKCRELTRMIASDELPEARWPVRMGGWLHLLMCAGTAAATQHKSAPLPPELGVLGDRKPKTQQGSISSSAESWSAVSVSRKTPTRPPVGRVPLRMRTSPSDRDALAENFDRCCFS